MAHHSRRTPRPCLGTTIPTLRLNCKSSVVHCPSIDSGLPPDYRHDILKELYFFKYILLIMLLQLSRFFLLFIPLHPAHPSLQQSPPPLSSCSRVVHISSLASPFPILFVTSPCPFYDYQLCLKVL